MTAIIEAKLKEKTNEEWDKIFAKATFPNGPVNNLQQVFKDPQVVHNNMAIEMEHSTLGTIKQVHLK